MLTDKSHEVDSNLTHHITVGGVNLNVHIFRLDFYPLWALEVVTELGGSMVWNELFDTDGEALAAFEAGADELGLSRFLADAHWDICRSGVQPGFRMAPPDAPKAQYPHRVGATLGSSSDRRRVVPEFELG